LAENNKWFFGPSGEGVGYLQEENTLKKNYSALLIVGIGFFVLNLYNLMNTLLSTENNYFETLK
jgi:hypothetical protein